MSDIDFSSAADSTMFSDALSGATLGDGTTSIAVTVNALDNVFIQSSSTLSIPSTGIYMYHINILGTTSVEYGNGTSSTSVDVDYMDSIVGTTYKIVYNADTSQIEYWIDSLDSDSPIGTLDIEDSIPADLSTASFSDAYNTGTCDVATQSGGGVIGTITDTFKYTGLSTIPSLIIAGLIVAAAIVATVVILKRK